VPVFLFILYMIDSPNKIMVIPRIAAQYVTNPEFGVVSFHGGGEKHTYPKVIKNVLYIDVADLDPEKKNHIKVAERYNLRIFDKEDAKKLVQFVNTIKPTAKKLLFQCEAGVSRSAGAASAVSKAWFNDDSKFIHESINRWIYNLILKEFGK